MNEQSSARKNQMELSLNPHRNVPPARRRQRRLTSARWWFDQMHSAADRGTEWPRATFAQPVQNLLLPTGSR